MSTRRDIQISNFCAIDVEQKNIAGGEHLDAQQILQPARASHGDLIDLLGDFALEVFDRDREQVIARLERDLDSPMGKIVGAKNRSPVY